MKHFVLCITLALAACQSTTVTSTSAPPQAVAAAPASSEMASRINAERSARGLAPLVEDARLSRAAQAHAADMVAQGYFSHTGANGSRFTQRAAAAGYGCAAAENIAQGQRTEAEVFAAWMNSPGHRRNILMSDAVQFGIGRVGNTWVQMFGRGC